jgi:hypothetical protein
VPRVATCRRREPALRLVHLPALAVDPRETCQRAEIRMCVNGQSTDRERVLVAFERLRDRGALRIEVGAVAPQGGRGVEVREGGREPVEDAPHPDARQEGTGLARHLVDELVRERRGPLGVRDATQHVAPQGDQLDQLGALPDGEPSLRRSERLTVDPSLEVPEGDDPRRRHRLLIGSHRKTLLGGTRVGRRAWRAPGPFRRRPDGDSAAPVRGSCATLARSPGRPLAPCEEHPLPDGNKRCAFLCVVEFAGRDGMNWQRAPVNPSEPTQ